MVDVALYGGRAVTTDVPSRSRTLGRLRLNDIIFRNITRGAALAVLVILGGVMIALAAGAWPALQAFGLNFLIEERWTTTIACDGSFALGFSLAMAGSFQVLISPRKILASVSPSSVRSAELTPSRFTTGTSPPMTVGN